MRMSAGEWFYMACPKSKQSEVAFPESTERVRSTEKGKGDGGIA